MKQSRITISGVISAAVLLVMITSFSGIAHPDHLDITLKANDYQILQGKDGFDYIRMEDFGSLLIPGKPRLPARTFSIALPPGARLTSVSFHPDPPVPIPSRYQMQHHCNVGRRD